MKKMLKRNVSGAGKIKLQTKQTSQQNASVQVKLTNENTSLFSEIKKFAHEISFFSENLFPIDGF